METIPYMRLDEIEMILKPLRGVFNSLSEDVSEDVWLDAINKEIKGLERSRTWVFVDTSPVG